MLETILNWYQSLSTVQVIILGVIVVVVVIVLKDGIVYRLEKRKSRKLK